MLDSIKNAEIEIMDWSDLGHLQNLMDIYGETTDEPFYGHNEIGEQISITICPNVIILGTFQNNGWYRKNYFYSDGTCEELFEGKWI